MRKKQDIVFMALLLGGMSILCIILILGFAISGSDQGLGLNKIIALLAGVALIVSACLSRGLVKSKILLYSVIVFFSYLLFDIAISLLYFSDILEPPSYYSASTWVFEDSGKTVQFDPIRGYTLTQVPSRWARMSKGTLEYVGILKGNKQGFPDEGDFSPSRKEKDEKRVAVFGDSFTAGQYLSRNWPEAVERMSHAEGTELELLNFSIDGGGLANWWSVLTKIVEEDHYEIDGIVFAVYPGDLRRKFTVSEHRGETGHARGRVPSWDPSTYPKSVEQARPFFETPYSSHIVTTDEFERFLRNEWKPPVRYQRKARLYFAWQVWDAFKGFMPKDRLDEFNGFDEGRLRLLGDVKQVISRMGVPVLVVHVPSRPQLLDGDIDPSHIREAKAFADLLGARYIDGTQAFTGQSKEKIKAMWLPYDAHWGQGGSDHFAKFMYGIMAEWLAK